MGSHQVPQPQKNIGFQSVPRGAELMSEVTSNAPEEPADTQLPSLCGQKTHSAGPSPNLQLKTYEICLMTTFSCLKNSKSEQ